MAAIRRAQKALRWARILAEVVTAGAEDGEERVAGGSLQRTARQAAVGLHVADLRFDGAAAAQELGERRRKPPAGAADQHARGLDAVPAVAAVDDGEGRTAIGQHLDLLESLGEGVAVVGVARQRPHADDEALAGGGGDADLGAELVSRTRALPLEMQSTSGSCRL